MASAKGRPTEPLPRHRVLREVYRHYLEYRDLVMSQGGTGVIEHGYWVYPEEAVVVTAFDEYNDPIFDKNGYHTTTPLLDEDGEPVVKELPRYKVSIHLSFWDLYNQLNKLSGRKREAVFYNVILDWKQKDVAKRMGITTVSVGQYVEQGMLQIAEDYYAEAVNA